MILAREKLANFGIKLEVERGSAISDLDRVQIFGFLAQEKLVLVRGLRASTKEELLRFAARDIETDLVHWNFGPVMEMQALEGAENYLFSHEAVPYHWDGAFHVEPRALVFHCIQAPSPEMGGETTFCDTELIWEEASNEEKNAWSRTELTYATEKKAHYGGVITKPMVARHPHTGNTILRYAEPVNSELNPVATSVRGWPKNEESLHESMREKLYSPRYAYAHRWQDNDLLLADNFSLLHGRNAFSQSSPRHLRRVQLK